MLKKRNVLNAEMGKPTPGDRAGLKKMRLNPQTNFSSVQNVAIFGKKCDLEVELANYKSSIASITVLPSLIY
jgi:hypothetical protein